MASHEVVDPDREQEEFAKMEAWLESHPEFVHDYFARKATRSMIDGWLISHAITHSIQSDTTNSSGSNSKAGSGANTPVRKISAQEFERGGLLKPMISTVDGMPTFIDTSPSTSVTNQNRLRKRRPKVLKTLDEKELMYELVIDICNDLDVTSLCYKILQNVCVLLNADRCSLFLVQGKGTGEKYLVSKLFDVSGDSTLDEISQQKREIKVSFGSGIIGHVAQSGEPISIPDAYEDPRFNDEVDLLTGYKTRSILSMPIKDSEGEVIGVAQAVNKIGSKEEPFDDRDEKIFSSYLAFCGIGLKNAQLYERSQLENRRNQVVVVRSRGEKAGLDSATLSTQFNQSTTRLREFKANKLVLLDLARVIFEEQNNVASLIRKIMMHTQSLLQCERCQVLLVDNLTKDRLNRSKTKGAKNVGVFSQVFDLQTSDFDNSGATFPREEPIEPRFPINIGITGQVATTGETLNIPDAYQDSRFDRSVDEGGKFKTKSILCMPIKNAIGKVIGVSQLVNKIDGTPFNKNDENIFEAFAIFCGMGINNTQMYETCCKALAKQRISLDVLSYHAIAPYEDAQRLSNLPIPSAQQYKLYDWGFSDFLLDDDDTLKASVRMFIDLRFIETFRINYETLCRWLLSVKKNYRNVTYHNWRHAFNVAQTMFCMLKNANMNNVLGDMECLALIIGCLSHDLDHRGTTNQFQIKTMSPLADLYSTSTLEHHHFDQCIMILNTKGNDFLSNLSQEKYEKVIQLLESAILSTDLALYFKYRGEFFNLASASNTDWSSEENKDLLRSMMMTASDIAAITKPWEVQIKVADMIANEFFEQGDMEKSQLNIKPMITFLPYPVWVGLACGGIYAYYEGLNSDLGQIWGYNFENLFFSSIFQDMMDRDKKDQLPNMQVGFIDGVCLPVYEAIAKVSPNFNPLLTGCQDNRDNWEKLAEERKKLAEEQKENTDKD